MKMSGKVSCMLEDSAEAGDNLGNNSNSSGERCQVQNQGSDTALERGKDSDAMCETENFQ